MAFIKTYQKVNKQNQNINFGISKMQDIYSTRNGKIDEPHRHQYFTVLIIKKAKGIHKIDFYEYEFENNQVFFVSPGQIHQVIEQDRPKGYVMIFSNDFLIQNFIPISFVEGLSLFQDYGQSPPLLPNKVQFKVIYHFLKKIYKLHNSKDAMKDFSIAAYLKLMLIECNKICNIHPTKDLLYDKSNQILKSFKEMVNKYYSSQHSTSFYANELYITPDHLNRIIKQKIGKTAKTYINSRIITEAKRLLFFSDLSNKEIGYQLGFNEPSNFSAFFKVNTKSSPSAFKNSISV